MPRVDLYVDLQLMHLHVHVNGIEVAAISTLVVSDEAAVEIICNAVKWVGAEFIQTWEGSEGSFTPTRRDNLKTGFTVESL